MGDDRPASLEDRVLLLAPTAKDAAAAGEIFAALGIPCEVCKDLDAICRAIAEGAGVAIVPDEAVLNDRERCLARVLANQPPWSDFPLIVLTSPHGESPGTIRDLEAVGHMTLVRRPVEIRSLASTVRTALRDRTRQHAAREYVLERERQAAALRTSEARLRAIIDSTPDCVKVVSAEGILLEINRAGLPMIEADDAESVVGRRIFDLIAPEHRDAYRAFHESVCRGQAGSIEFEIVGLRGTRRHVETHSVPLLDADGRVTHLAVTLDITARKQAEREREQFLAETQRAKAQADAANRMKDEFLATLSHELRTPLNAILGWARILRTGQVDRVDLEEGLAAIERNSIAQAQIIEDLLDVSRIIAGKFRLEVQSVLLQDVIESAVAAVMPAASARGIRLDKVLDSLAGPVSGDPARLQQVVWNLLSNAVKFTPKGGKVRILLERVNSHVEVSVIDTGTGIKPEFLPHVFDRFRQADSSSTRRHSGLGLGLAIVKQLVEMHGGTVRAKSAGEGQGATFTVMLPISVVHPLHREQPRPKHDDPGESDRDDGNLTGVRVLVVDDEPDARRLIERVLAECGAEVALASSAVEALDLLDDFRPHVLVSDIGMPDHDGYDLLRTVRSRGKSAAEIPAAALTAFARSEDRRRALLAGFQTHVAKPVDPAELLAVVASLAGRTGGG